MIVLVISMALHAAFFAFPERGAAKNTPETRRDLARGVNLAIARYGLDIGAWVYLENAGVVYERAADTYKPAASAIKSFIALDFLMQRQDDLNQAFPEPVTLLSHHAFSGFTPEGLREAGRELSDKTYWEIAEIMMGQGGQCVEVYNAACNLILIDLGGPRAVMKRIHDLSPGLRGLDLHRYMEQWHGHGDNMVTPRTLAELYVLLSRNAIPEASPEIHRQLRSFLASAGNGHGKTYEKSGTLYPAPMARVRAGYVEHPSGNLVYALMGTMQDPKHLELPDAFVLLLASMDTLTNIIQEVF